MSFCTFSSESIIQGKISVDNMFIHEYMPSAPENFTKVYLYGMYICSNSATGDNSLENFAKKLSLTEDEVITAFYYWKEQGLVQVLDTDPIQIKYMPINNIISSLKKYKKGRFDNFNAQLHQILKGRVISMHEYHVYYDLIEREKFEELALLNIIKYCTELKGTNVGHAYITAVARNWAADNVLTSEKVDERIKEYSIINSVLGEVLKTLGIKRAAAIDERDYFNKWTKILHYTEEDILQVAKYFKKSKLKINFDMLDKKIEKYNSLHLFSSQEIINFEEQREEYKLSAIEIVKELGLYYENLEPVIENYIISWFNMGYDKESLIQIAKFCFSKNYRTLSTMNNIINKLYKLGIVSLQSIFEYMNDLSAYDQTIKTLLEKLGLSRNVNSSDRTFYKTWTEDWKINDELMEYGITLAKDKVQPTVYLNKIFASFHESKIETVEQAKELSLQHSKSPKKSSSKNHGKSYSKNELNAFFDSIEEIEV